MGNSRHGPSFAHIHAVLLDHAKIQDLDYNSIIAGHRNANVVGLHVTMQIATLVERGKACRQLHANANDLGNREVGAESSVPAATIQGTSALLPCMYVDQWAIRVGLYRVGESS